METSKRHKKLLLFWLKFKHTDRPSIASYLKGQPKCYWLGLLGMGCLYGIDFYLWGFNELLTGILIGSFASLIGMFARFRKDWRLSRELIQWDKVKEITKKIANSLSNDGLQASITTVILSNQ